MTFVKLDNPAILPAGAGFGVAFPYNGIYLAVASYSSPFILFYKRSGNIFTKLSNPSTLPAGIGFCVSCSADGVYWAVGHANSPYITIYKRTGDTFTKLSNPSTLPPEQVQEIAFSTDGVYLVTYAGTGTPKINIYKRSGDTFTKIQSDPTGIQYPWGIGLSYDGVYLIVIQQNDPPAICKRSGDTFSKIGDLSAPSGDGKVRFSPDNIYSAWTSGTSIRIYKRSDDTFNRISDPSPPSLPASGNAAFSFESMFLAFAHKYSPYVTIYERSGDTFAKISDPATLPTGTGYSAAFSMEGNALAVGHSNYPYVTIYLYNQPPFAPTSLSPNGVAFPAGEPKQFTWQHNPIGGEAQTHYELQYRVQGAPSWTTTGKTASSTSSHTFPAATFTDGNQYEWQVRTWSEGAVDPGDWSSIAVFTCYSRPTATITYPPVDLHVHGSGTITAEWNFSQAQGNQQAAYQVKLYASSGGVRGAELWDSGEVNSSAQLHAITYLLEGPKEYQIGLQVKSDAGLWSAAEIYRIFSTEFVSPAKPTVTLTPDNDGARIIIEITNPEPTGEQPEVTHNDIYRRVTGGEWIRIFSSVAQGAQVIDYNPGHEITYEYKAIAHGVNQGTIESEPESASVSFPGWILLTPVDSPTEGIKVQYNITRDFGIEPDIVLHHFAGRSKPVSFAGEAITIQLSLGFVFKAWEAAGRTLLENFEAMVKSGGTILYRTGHPSERTRRMFGVIQKPSVNEVDTSVWTVSLIFTETDHDEEV